MVKLSLENIEFKKEIGLNILVELKRFEKYFRKYFQRMHKLFPLGAKLNRSSGDKRREAEVVVILRKKIEDIKKILNEINQSIVSENDLIKYELIEIKHFYIEKAGKKELKRLFEQEEDLDEEIKDKLREIINIFSESIEVITSLKEENIPSKLFESKTKSKSKSIGIIHLSILFMIQVSVCIINKIFYFSCNFFIFLSRRMFNKTDIASESVSV